MPRRKSVAKTVLILLLSLIVVSSCLVSCQKKGKVEEEKQPTYLFLGDSIAEALLGPSPISERDSYGYYSIVGQVNGAHYVNRAISGLTTIGFKNSLCNRGYYEEPDGFYREYWIKQADVIFISMLGNDLLSAYMVDYAIETGVQSTAKGKEDVSESFTERMQERCVPNVNAAMDRIYSLNPDVTVIWQTLYNPFTDNTVLLDEDDWARYNEKIASGEIDSKYSFRDIADILVRAVNGIVYDWQAAHPDKKFFVSDVKGAFDAVFAADQAAGESLIFSDWIHPSVRGHALIAKCLEDTLCSIGLSDKGKATEKYKQLVLDRIDRLYPDQSAVKTAVGSESTFEGITSAYFSATSGVSPDYKSNAVPYEGGFLEYEKRYPIVSMNLSGAELSTIDLEAFAEEMEFDIDENLLGLFKLAFPDGVDILDEFESYFYLDEEGNFEISFSVNPQLLAFANSLLEFPQFKDVIADFDVMDFYYNVPFCDYNTTYDMYFSELFPGFGLTDLKKSLSLLSSVGCTIEGIDVESEEFKAFDRSLNTTGKLPEGFKLPSTLSIKLRGYYTIERLGEGDEARDVVYFKLVRTGKDTVPMFCAFLGENETSKYIVFKIEFCSLRILGQTEKN